MINTVTNTYGVIGAPMCSINDLLVRCAKELQTNGNKVYNERTKSSILECRNVRIMGHPKFRFISVPERANSISAQIIESLMVLSGNPDLNVLSKFLPRAYDYSDDGEIWRANYGTRLRGNWAKCNPFFNHPDCIEFEQDQLKRVINQLREDKSTRQAFVSISNSWVDFGLRAQGTKDLPCTMTLTFGLNHLGKLELSTYMRSNDFIFGFSGVNYFIFTLLQELVAKILDLELGAYVHNAVSFHVYEPYFKTVDNIVEKASVNRYSDFSFESVFDCIVSVNQFDDICQLYFNLIENLIKADDGSNECDSRSDKLVNEFIEAGNKLTAGLFSESAFLQFLLIPLIRVLNHTGAGNTLNRTYDIYLDDNLKTEIIARDKFLYKPLNLK